MQLTPQQARLQEDIGGLIDGEVRCDTVVLQLYSTDAGIYESVPQSVVWPRSTADVVAVLQYASERGISVHPRGSGTGTMGGSLGNGIILDFTRFMRRAVISDDNSVKVQPGAIRSRMNAMIRRTSGRIFGPDPGFAPCSSIGSILASDGAGSRWMQYGSPRDHLLGCQIVLANGEVLEFRTDKPEPVREFSTPEGNTALLQRSLSLAREIVHGKANAIAEDVYRVLSPNRELIDRFQPPGTPDRTGYRLEGVLKGTLEQPSIDLARLIAGSEGTLGVVTEAYFRTVIPKKHSMSVLLLFETLEKAARSIPILLPYKPASCELLDRRLLALLRKWDARFAGIIPRDTEAILLVELEGDEKDGLEDRLHAMLGELKVVEKPGFPPMIAKDENEESLFRELLESGSLALYRMPQGVQAVPLFGDYAVPIELLHLFLQNIQDLFKRHELTASFSGHIGHGHVRIRPIVDITGTKLFNTIERIIGDVNEETIRFGGTLSSESVCGIGQLAFIPMQHPELYPLFREIKRIFDPEMILNPEKVVSKYENPRLPMFRSLIYRADAVSPSKKTDKEEHANRGNELEDLSNGNVPGTVVSQLELQLKWNPESIAVSTYRCNGCGRCRSRERNIRMCPVFKSYPDESAAPRSKPNLLRGVLEGDIDLQVLTDERSKTLAELCLQCRMCKNECPASVDVTHLSFREKSAFVSAHGLPMIDQVLSNIDTITKSLGYFSCPSNWCLHSRFVRWFLEKIIDLPQGRILPRIATVSFLRRAKRENLNFVPESNNKRKIALFLDVYSNYYDTRLADAAIKVLEHNDVLVHVPPRQKVSGRSAIASGNMHKAEYLARRNIPLLSDFVRQGYEIVTIEPSSSTCISQEYSYVSEDPELEILSEHTHDICRYLYDMYLKGDMKCDFINPVQAKIAYHAPCRTLALQGGSIYAPTPAELLLGLIPELQIERIERGCCGMSGTFGMKKSTYRQSLRIGMNLFRVLRDHDFIAGSSECNSCKMQMEQGTRKPTVHPIKLLASAYGLIPEKDDPLNVKPKKLTVT